MSLEFDQTMTARGRSAAVREPAGEGLAAGTLFAHFEIEKRLGKGGMGEVYLARDVALERPVALKIIDPEIAGNTALRERFYREARSQARIQHPNICHIYYIGEDGGRLFFAMEYIDGPSLQQVLDDKGKLSPGEAIELCRQVALALREAWRHGFTHRDIKPSNLMLDRHGTVKVVDFGIVKQTEPSVAAPALAGTDLTADRSVLGTPFYLSPEQARGDPVDFRSDIYSLGATLHELISGEPPFRGATAMKIIAQHLTDSRPRFTLTGARKLTTGPVAIDELVDRMMAKSPDARFTSYDELIAAIDSASPARVRPAGMVVRAVALAIDVAIVFSIGNASAELIDKVVPDLAAFAFIEAVPALLFALYWIGMHARWGGTVGKRLLEIRVEPVRGDARAGWWRSAGRFAFLFGPLYILNGLTDVLEIQGVTENLTVPLAVAPWLLVGVYALIGGLVSANKRMYWDRLAGTQVRYTTTVSRGS